MKPIYIIQIGFSALKDQKKWQGIFLMGVREENCNTWRLVSYSCAFYRKTGVKRFCTNTAYGF